MRFQDTGESYRRHRRPRGLITIAAVCGCLLLAQLVAGQNEQARVNPVTKKLAADLVSAATESERTALLEAHREVVNAELCAEINRQGDSFAARADYTKALALYLVSQNIAEQIHDDSSIAAALNATGRIYSQQGQHAKSLELRQKALAIYEKLADKPAVAEVLNDIGVSYRRQSNYDLAIQYYSRSLELKDQLGDREGMAGTLTSMGVAEDARGDFAQALAHHQRALALRDAITDPDVLVSIFNNLGATNQHLGNYAAAIGYYNQALNHPQTAKDPVGQSIYLRNIGNVYIDEGDYQNALACLTRGLALIERTDDKVGIATAYNNIGVVHRWQGNYSLALDYYNRSLKLREELGDRSGIASNHTNIGRVYFLTGEYRPALEHLAKALEIREAIKTRSAIPATLSLIGATHLARGDLDQALTNLKHSLEVAESIGDRRGVADALLFSARVLKAQAKDTEALELLGRAGSVAAQIGIPELYWQTKSLAGQIHAAQGRLPEAAENFQEAIRVIESLRQRVSGGERERQLFFEDKLTPYQEMLKLLVAAKQPLEALRFAERANARVLIDVLSRGRSGILKSMTASEQEQEQQLEARLTSLNAQRAFESQRPTPDQTRLSGLQKNLQQARLDLEEFYANLYAVHPELKAFRGEDEPLTKERLQGLVANRQTALLEFAATSDKQFLFVTERGAGPNASLETKVYELSLKPQDIAARAEAFRRAIAERDAIDKEARELYELLLRPAKASLTGKTSLVIVPGSTLWSLPFQALQSAPNHFLLEDAVISYAPSLTALIAMHGASKQLAAKGAVNLLAFANPASGPDSAAPAQEPLVDAEREASEIGKLYDAHQSRIFIGPEAREERVKTDASQFRILHFATHGVLDNNSPMYSHVVLATPAKYSKEDGLLEAREIMDLDLHADLVVLSACETARGRIGAGEGVIGMSWALFVAGASTTIATQWKIPSRSASDLMIDFHRNLLNPKLHLSKATALQQASLNQLRHGPFRHPFYWAGFVLIGDGSSTLR